MAEREPNNPIAEAFELAKAYAKQETIDPLKSLGRFLAFGIAGGLLLALGFIFLLFAGLRALQTETTVFDGGWSFVPYAIVVVAGFVLAGLFAMRIKKGLADG